MDTGQSGSAALCLCMSALVINFFISTRYQFFRENAQFGFKYYIGGISIANTA